MRIVSLLAPIRCGVYQFHSNLVRGLAQHECSITWLCSGSANARLIANDSAEPSDGEIVASGTDDLATRTRALIDRVRDISPDVILCQLGVDRVDFNAVRYLPDTIPRILILHGSSISNYRSARAVRDHVNATVAISPRIEQDLTSAYGFQKERLCLIPNGIDIARFSGSSLNKKLTGRLRILSHGRIDKQKGVFWLPEILAELAHSSDEWSCTISGDGPDLAELRRRFVRAGISDRIHFAGWTSPEDVPALMNQHDIFLFPSKFEGYPIALIEAMAGGCVPVASLLPGITDTVIQDGINGLLFPVGNVRRAVQHLVELLSNRPRLIELRQRARDTANEYSLDRMAGRYYQLIGDLQSHPPQILPAESLENCALADGLKPSWWYRLPSPIKDHLRLARERIRNSVRIP